MSKIIAIGALGGSGTRAVAQILIDAGVYLGDDLNESNDNLIFTRLFKNPGWYKNPNNENVCERLEIFRKMMIGERLSSSEKREFIKAAKENPTHKSDFRFYLKTRLNFTKPNHERDVWGWKEPNTQIFLDEINDVFPEFRYVHVLRHGLDMAFSDNIQQLQNWGYKFNVPYNGNESKNELAVKQLDYWIRSTKEVMKKGKEMGQRFYLLNYTKFYQKPVQEIDSLLDFVSLDIDLSLKEKLYKIPKKPPTADRFKKFDLGIFRNDQIEIVKEMGFEL